MASLTLAPPITEVVTPATGRRRGLVASLSNETTLLLLLIGIGFLAQSFNMFHYPSFTIKDDEGIYTEQAWAVLREGRLAHYTYTYDHSPGGWLQLAAWYAATGGIHTFGNSVDSGRVLMLLLHLAMIPLLYGIARKLGCSLAAAALAVFIFSVSPLAVFYQRMVLLDNFMLFWVLLSLTFLLDGRGRLSRLCLSGFCFGLALISKETAIFLLPVGLFLVWQQRWKHQGRFAGWAWLVPMVLLVSWYPLYALFKGELLPNPHLVVDFTSGGNGNPVTGVSLLDALKWQSSRKDEGTLWKDIVYGDWLPRDAFLLIGGAVASAINLAWGLRDRRYFVVGALGLLPLYYLFRGGVVFSYYIAFATPFLALNLAFLANLALSRLPKLAAGTLATTAAVGLLVSYWLAGTLQPLYTEQPDQAGREATAWVKQNLPADSRIIMRDDMWADMHESDSNGPAFPNAHTHWKVAYDPAVYDGVFKNDWHNVDYLIMGAGLNYAFDITKNKLALDALSHAQLIKRWVSDRGDVKLHEPQLVEIWKVNKDEAPQGTLLAGSASYLTNSFEQAGAYIGPDGAVTASSQANALLRAVWMDDQAGFNRVWQWTQSHLLTPKKLLNWQWRNGVVTDPHSAADADSDTALALLLASKRWDDPTLLEAGRQMVGGIWQSEVTSVTGTPYLTAGDWAANASLIPLNPSYFAPYAYRIFQEVDPGHDWQGVITAGYDVLSKASSAKLGFAQAAGVPPDWIGLNRQTGLLEVLTLAKQTTTNYGSEAARTYWRIALDLRWSGDGRARTFLNQAEFLRSEIKRKGYISAVYAHDGTVVKDAPSLVTTTGVMAALMTLDPNRADSIYRDQIAGGVSRTGSGVFWKWGLLSDLDTNEWGWFAVAMYNNALPDLWHNGNHFFSQAKVGNTP